jgi:hypothetical protein
LDWCDAIILWKSHGSGSLKWAGDPNKEIAMNEDANTDQPQGTQPVKEHEWLQQLVGEWTWESECYMGPDKPWMKSAGTESVRSLGGLWVILEGSGAMPDGDQYSSIMTLGYDLTPKKYVGTWIGSMMSRLWVYDITLAPSGDELWMEAEGPSMADVDKLGLYRDVITIKSPKHRILSGNFKSEDGKWTNFMVTHYHRVK